MVGDRAGDREVRQGTPGRADSLAALSCRVGRERGRVLGIGLVLGVRVVEVPLGHLVEVGEVGGLSATLVAGHGVHVLAVHRLVGCRHVLMGGEGADSDGADGL